MLKHRVQSAFVILAVVLATVLWLPSWAGWLVLIAGTMLAQYEFYGFIRRSGIPAFWILGLVCGAALVSAVFFTVGPSPGDMRRSAEGENMVLLASLAAVLVRQLIERRNAQRLATMACTLLGVLYVPFLMNYFARLAFAWEGAFAKRGLGPTGMGLVLLLILVVKVSDTGAYTVGKLWGRHKMFPRISPGKTWEGAVGGLSAGLLASCAFAAGMGYRMGELHLSLAHAVALGVLLPAAGMLGDMAESLLKRSAGIKDAGDLVPGFGGVLDVLDSLLFGAPVLYLYAVYVLA